MARTKAISKAKRSLSCVFVNRWALAPGLISLVIPLEPKPDLIASIYLTITAFQTRIGGPKQRDFQRSSCIVLMFAPIRKYSITLRTHCEYSSPSSLCHNQMHLRPRDLPYQSVHQSCVEVSLSRGVETMRMSPRSTVSS